MMYNKIVNDFFFAPQHVGTIDLLDPLVVCFRSNREHCSVVIELYIQCNNKGLITKACFKTNGNPYVIACLEWLCRQMIDKEIDKLPCFNYQLLMKELEIPTSQYPVTLQIEEAGKEALLLMKKKLEDYE